MTAPIISQPFSHLKLKEGEVVNEKVNTWLDGQTHLVRAVINHFHTKVMDMRDDCNVNA